jgi:hypothetical protein
VEKISEVLLADGWHKVSPVGDGRSSFGMGAYEFLEGRPDPQENRVMELKGGEPKGGEEEPVRPAGARWTEADGSRVFVPVTSILAVKYAGQKKQ